MLHAAYVQTLYLDLSILTVLIMSLDNVVSTHFSWRPQKDAVMLATTQV